MSLSKHAQGYAILELLGMKVRFLCEISFLWLYTNYFCTLLNGWRSCYKGGTQGIRCC